MPGPLPKPLETRRRRNRSSTAARFTDDGSARPKRRPELPRSMPWHTLTKSWWRDVWTSPMAPEYLKVDVHGLYRLAMLVNRFWITGGDKELAAEIRLQGQLFGLTPIDRRRLQWEVARAEEAEEQRKRRKPPTTPVADPRSIIRAVS